MRLWETQRLESAPKNLTFEHQPGSNAHIQQDRVLVWKTPRVQCCTHHRWGVFTKQETYLRLVYLQSAAQL